MARPALSWKSRPRNTMRPMSFDRFDADDGFYRALLVSLSSSNQLKYGRSPVPVEKAVAEMAGGRSSEIPLKPASIQAKVTN